METLTLKTLRPDKKTIIIALPNTGHFYFETVARLLSFQIPEGYQLMFNLISNCLIYDAREKLVEFALEQPNATHIFFLDSDMVPETQTLTQLIGWDVPIVTAKIYQRKFPFQPCFYTKVRINRDFTTELEGPMEPEQWPTDGIYDIEGCGMACCLINLKVFEGLKKPWFFPMPGVGEDLAFCVKARSAGHKLYADFGLDCAHMGYFPVVTASFQNAYSAWMNNPENKGKLIYGGNE